MYFSLGRPVQMQGGEERVGEERGGEGEGGREGCMSDEKEGRNFLLLLHKSKPDFMKI